jgi:exopolysaccharide production protein ExoQ
MYSLKVISLNVLLSKVFEKVFVIFSIIFYTNAGRYLLTGNSESQNSPVIQISIILLLIITVFKIISWHKKILSIAIKEKILWALMLIIFISFLWSDFPGITLIKSFTLFGINLFGVYFGGRYTIKEQLQFLTWAFGILTFLSFLLALFVPSLGVMGQSDFISTQENAHIGAWKGIFRHKNILGRFMVLSGIIFLIRVVKNNKKNRMIGILGLNLSLFLIIGSTSKTALAILFILISLIPLYRNLKINKSSSQVVLIIVILIIGCAATMLVSNIEAVLGNFGRDLTLTGRTEIWEAALEKAWERPWLGYGYGAFWQDGGESSYVQRVVGWIDLSHSHNGFLDLWLDLGLLGLFIFIASYITVWIKAIKWVQSSRDIEGIWPILYLTFLLLVNLSESTLLISGHNFTYMLYVATTLGLHHSNCYQLNKI